MRLLAFDPDISRRASFAMAAPPSSTAEVAEVEKLMIAAMAEVELDALGNIGELPSSRKVSRAQSLAGRIEDRKASYVDGDAAALESIANAERERELAAAAAGMPDGFKVGSLGASADGRGPSSRRRSRRPSRAPT